MKAKSQALEADGFERVIAEKMPKMKKEEEVFLSKEANFLGEEFQKGILSGEKSEKISLFEPSSSSRALREELDLSNLIEDLQRQLIASQKAQRAIELDKISYQKAIQQLTLENKDLRNQLEAFSKELQRLKENVPQLEYLKEENEEALERIKELQQELRLTKENLTNTLKEKEEASHRIQNLEYQLDQLEIAQMRERLKEKEASQFNEENLQLRARLAEALSQNLELEKKVEALKRSFHEVKESLTILRDSYKKDYYSLSDPSDENLPSE